MSCLHLVSGDRLKRKLEQSAAAADCTIDWMVERTSQWHSTTLVGGRHAFTLLLAGMSGRAWLEDLDEHSFRVPGFALAQLDVGTVEEKQPGQLLVEIEAITIKEV